MIAIRPVHEGDAAFIAGRMRRADRRECHALGLMPLDALMASLRNSVRSWTATLDDLPICLFGVAPWPDAGHGRPWALGTDGCTARPIPFVAAARRMLPEMLAAFPHLSNYVDARNRASRRFLSALGFRLNDPVPLGRDGEMFLSFWMDRP